MGRGRQTGGAGGGRLGHGLVCNRSCICSMSPSAIPLALHAAASRYRPLPACCADDLQELLSQIDADSDLEAFTQTAASSVHG